MAEINKALENLRSAAGDLVNAISDLDSRIAACHSKRDAITSAPVSRDDFLGYIKADIARRGRSFAGSVARSITGHYRDFGRLENLNADGGKLNLHYLTGQIGIPTVITEEALYFYVGDRIAERLGDLLAALPWPEDAIPVAERAKMLVELDREIAKLTKERDALAQQMVGAGTAG